MLKSELAAARRSNLELQRGLELQAEQAQAATNKMVKVHQMQLNDMIKQMDELVKSKNGSIRELCKEKDELG